jgi:hypothetical protein
MIRIALADSIARYYNIIDVLISNVYDLSSTKFGYISMTEFACT